MKTYIYHNAGNAGRDFSRLYVWVLPEDAVADPEIGIVRLEMECRHREHTRFSVALNREQVHHLAGILNGVLALNFKEPVALPMIEEADDLPTIKVG